jgi:hypothetical protein
MPRVGFERTNPEFDLAKTVHDVDRAGIVVGWTSFSVCYFEQDITFSK